MALISRGRAVVTQIEIDQIFGPIVDKTETFYAPADRFGRHSSNN